MGADGASKQEVSSTKPSLAPLLPSSVIVCSRGRPAFLADAVHEILEGETVPSEIVVVDQSSTAHEELGKLGTVRACEVRYLWTPKLVGLSRASNEAVAAARHDALIFTHDDVLPAADWHRVLVHALADLDERTVITGRVLPGKAENGRFAPSLMRSEARTLYEGRESGGVLQAPNMALHRGAFEAVGGFDEQIGPGTPFPAAEDNDFSYRLLRAGFRILYEPDAVVYHRQWRSNRDFLRLRWSYGLGQGAFYWKHVNRGDQLVRRLMVGDLVGRAVGLLRLALRDRRRAVGNLVYTAGVLQGALRWQIGERRSPPPLPSPAGTETGVHSPRADT